MNARSCVFHTPWKTLHVSHTAYSPYDDGAAKGGDPTTACDRFDQVVSFVMINSPGEDPQWFPFR